MFCSHLLKFKYDVFKCIDIALTTCSLNKKEALISWILKSTGARVGMEQRKSKIKIKAQARKLHKLYIW